MYVSGKRFMAFMTSTHLYGLTFLEITAKKYVFRQYFIVKVSVMLGNFAVIFFYFYKPSGSSTGIYSCSFLSMVR